MEIWALVSTKYPDWELNIYGNKSTSGKYSKQAKILGVQDSVHFYDPIKNIQEKYMESSIYLMTSRFEGFGMVLIEAMAFRVPCILFNCHWGPDEIISDQRDGFIVQNGNIEGFANKLERLMAEVGLRKKMGPKAREKGQKYLPGHIVPQWDKPFKELIFKE